MVESSEFTLEDEDTAGTPISAAVSSVLNSYCTAVYSEMCYLRDNGGRRYKVTNGRYIGKSGEAYAYSFELESELFLSDDAPITFTSGAESASGNVFACEDFQLLVTLEKHVGDKIASGHISVEPWKLLDSLGSRLRKLTPRNKVAIALLEGANLKTDDPIEGVDVGQDEAMRHALEDVITVIWGPPGTGKTHTMAEIAIRFMGMGKSVLVVSHSNISVDGVAGKIAELMRARGLQDGLSAGKVMRFGYVRDEALAKDPDVPSYNFAIRQNAALRAKMDLLEKERDKLKDSGLMRSEKRIKVENEIKALRKKIAEKERDCVNGAQVVATTVSRLYANKLFEDRLFDVVMFDEVSMAYVPQVVCAAMFAREKMVCVGDFRQLPPIAQGKAAKRALSMDIFWYLGICDRLQNAHYHPWLVMLDEQRRMHPDISAFSSRKYYKSLLKDHPSVIGGREPIVQAQPFPRHAMSLVDLSGSFYTTGRNSDHSRFNVLSAAVCFALGLEAEGDGCKVGIIAPYAAQVRLVRAMVQDLRTRKRKTDLACATVHQFQGSERDVILMDLVEGPPSKKPGILMSSNENGNVDRLVNVGVTRARGKLVAVAHRGFWSSQPEGERNSFSSLIEHQAKRNNLVSIKDGGLEELFSGLDFGPNIKAYQDLVKAVDTFVYDIDRAVNKISLSMPDGRLIEGWAERVTDALIRARVRGVEVTLKCLDWKSLPEGWRAIGWQSDDAFCPLCIVDGKIAWYGMPLVEGRFELGSGRGSRVAIQVPLRLIGECTVDMISSLSDVDARVVDGQKKPIKQRSSTAKDNGSGNGQDGLALYVSEKERCPRCKAPMKLVKSRSSGKFFLGCSSCKETALLSKEFVNHYICVKQARCPKCKSYLTAKVSKYGIYIKCDNAHTLKPDEI